jgi:hypothetical protein
MPKDTERNRYYSIAVPKKSKLQKFAEAEHDDTNVAIGQLIVIYATKYVEMVSSGTMPMVPAQANKEGQSVQVSGVQVLATPLQHSISAEELDMYGEPD